MFLSQRSNVGERLPTAINELLMRLSQELSCPICLSVFTDPLITPCMHAFCRDCITVALRQCGVDGEKRTAAAQRCPVCKAAVSRRSMVVAVEVQQMVDGFKAMCEAYERAYGHGFDSPSVASDKQQQQQEEEDNIESELKRIIMEREEALDKLVPGEEASEETENYSSTLPIPSSPDPFLFQSIPPDNIGDKPVKDETPLEPKPRGRAKSTVADKTGNTTKPNTRVTKRTTKIKPANAQNETSFSAITFSGMKREEDMIAQFVSKYENITVTDTIVDSSTLLVMPTKGNNTGIVKRTYKYMMAILMGCPVVSANYLQDALNGDYIDINKYIVSGDEYDSDNIVLKSRQSHQLGEPGLFHNLRFYLYGHFDKPSRHDLRHLILAGGGATIDDIHKLAKGCVIVCDPTTTGSFEKDAGIISKYRPIIGTAWIYACISSYSLQEKRDFIVL